MITKSKFITRKEIASANELSDDKVALSEKIIGLDKCRDRACARPIRYRAKEAAEALELAGWFAP
jgi:hypothetical protein